MITSFLNKLSHPLALMSEKLEGKNPVGVAHPAYPQVRGRHLKAKAQSYSSLALLVCVALSLCSFFPQPWSLSKSATQPSNISDPAEEWKDDVWPLRPQTPWDISTDFPHPRTIEYDVTEGTWLRLDVHPQTGDIVFDMLGDIYCLPASVYLRGTTTRAVPVLLGVPHDSDPHFSPQGDKLAFRSDAGLGLENIWVTEWTGCEAMGLRPPFDASIELAHALKSKDEDDNLLVAHVKESDVARERRLIREGRYNGMCTAQLSSYI